MTSADNPKTILLKGDVIAKEAQAGGSVVPGELLTLNTDGEVVRAGAEANIPARVAREPELVGGSIDDEYEAGDTVPYYIGYPGAEFYVRLAASQDIAVGALLEAAPDGQVRALDDGVALFTAVEAVETTGEVKRIKVEVL